MMKRRMGSLALSLVCVGMALSVSGHAGWAPQKAQAVSSMSGLELPALKKTISKRFVNTKLSEVLAWLSLEELSFVADSGEFPQSGTVTLSFRNQPLGAVLDAIADAFNGRWERRGDIFTLRPQNITRNILGSMAPPMGEPSEPELFKTTPETSVFAPIAGRSASPAELPLRTTRTAPAALAPGQATTAAPLPPLPAEGRAYAPSGLSRSSVSSPISPFPAEAGAIRARDGRAFTIPALPGSTSPTVTIPSELPAKTMRVPGTLSGAAVATPFVWIGQELSPQDKKAHEEAMREVEKALRMAEQEMRKLHESGEYKKHIEEALAHARSLNQDEHKKALIEAEKAMAHARNMNQDEHKKAMIEAEREMAKAKVLHGDEMKKAMAEAEREMANAKVLHADEMKKAMAEAEREMAKARKELQDLPNSKEWKESIARARQEIAKALKEGKVQENGKSRPMTAKERESLQNALKALEGIKLPNLQFNFDRMAPLFERSFVMPKFDSRAFTVPKIDGKTFVMPKIDGKAFTFATPEGRAFTIPKGKFLAPEDPQFKAHNEEIRKHIEEMNKRMKEMGLEGKIFAMPNLEGKLFSVPKVNSRVFSGPTITDKQLLIPKVKIEGLPELKAFERTRPMLLDSRRMRISELLNSLTSAQKEKQEKQGYLTLSDLTPKQREMLGDIPEGGNWTFSYSIDGKKLTVKNK